MKKRVTTAGFAILAVVSLVLLFGTISSVLTLYHRYRVYHYDTEQEFCQAYVDRQIDTQNLFLNHRDQIASWQFRYDLKDFMDHLQKELPSMLGDHWKTTVTLDSSEKDLEAQSHDASTDHELTYTSSWYLSTDVSCLFDTHCEPLYDSVHGIWLSSWFEQGSDTCMIFADPGKTYYMPQADAAAWLGTDRLQDYLDRKILTSVNYLPYELRSATGLTGPCVTFTELPSCIEGPTLSYTETLTADLSQLSDYEHPGNRLLFLFRIRFALIGLGCCFGIVFLLSILLLWKRALGRLLLEILKKFPFTWKSSMFLLAFAVLVQFIILNGGFRYRYEVLFSILNLVFCISSLLFLAGFTSIEFAAKEMASGNIEYKIPSEPMLPSLRTHAEYMNTIGTNLDVAIAHQLKAERMKTELITNVSHDIKTPLTSIINYVDLMKNPDLSPEERAQYLEVLDRQSSRLKTLLEDLLEASRASSGNVEIIRSDLDLSELVIQMVAEYDDKLASRSLQLVLNTPDTPVILSADGRHLSRVIGNLFSNVCKYAIPGSRVYTSLQEAESLVTLEIKNISESPLNIPAEELMERFVRGDQSRSTSGSGLGLSIASSLMKLMGGTLALSIDGDLFKATITLPKV